MVDPAKDATADKDAEREKELEQQRRQEEERKKAGRKDQRKQHLEPTLTWIEEKKGYAMQN